jgi:alpha-tubulin suppressor-like RCC1 family protein
MRIPLVSAAVCLVLSVTASAQWMQHDNWRVSGTEFGSPTNNTLRSIAVGSGGVYVAEVNGNNPTQILQFTEAGAFVRRFGASFGYIHGIACDAAGNVYVLSRGNTRVRVFDAAGTFLREWGEWGNGNGQFDLDAATGNTMIGVSSKTDEVFVCDPGNSRVQVFSKTGTFLRKFGQAGSLPGQFQAGSPSAIAVSDNGHLILGNSNGASDPTIKIFDSTGLYLRGVGLEWAGFNVYGLAVTNDGLVFVNYAYGNNQDYAGYLRDYLLDPSENYGNIGGIPAIKSFNGAAFSKRGDFYSVNGNRVAIAIREYTDGSNFPAAPGIPQPMILSASQRAGANLVDVDYQVKDSDSGTVSTALLAVRDGDNRARIGYSVGMRTFVEGTSANVGANQPTGVTRRATWNMPADWAIDYATFEIEALAKDSRSLLPIHWVTVPASGADPAFQVSSAPVIDTQLRNLWLWFLANGQVTQTYYNHPSQGWLGTAFGTSGVFTGVKLAEDMYVGNPYWDVRTVSTPAGRVFALEQMQSHPITPTELTRAQAGKFGLSSVDTNSIVKNLAPTTSYLMGWGDNTYGQRTALAFSAPNISKVAAGGSSTFYIRADATLWAVGYNGYGQLGDGTTTDRSGPVQIATGVTQVATGGQHTLFVKTDGTLWAMGNNQYGQLGDGTIINRLVPVQVPSAANVSQVSCGSGHSMFLKTDGSLWAMGYNLDGRLGDTTTDQRLLAVPIDTGVAQISAGAAHSLYVKSDGTLWAAGSDNYGQLGAPTTANRPTPFQVATGVRQASAAGYGGSDNYGHSVFVKNDNTLWAMGRNNYGQLGDGTTNNSPDPIQIMAGVSKAYGGALHTVFVKTDNTLWSMGHNGSGQLGDNTTNNRSTPAQFSANAAAIAIGAWHNVAITLP